MMDIMIEDGLCVAVKSLILIFSECDYTCVTCVSTSTTCLSCPSNSSLVASSCECDSGYFDNGLSNCVGNYIFI